MNRKAYWIHATAVIAGLALAVAWPGAGGNVAENVTGKQKSSSASELAAAEESNERTTRNSSRGDTKREYAKAWEQMLRESDNSYEASLQRNSLLKDWADVDLKAALSAALALSKWKPGDKQWNPLFNHLGAFDEVILRRPIEFFDLLKGDPFGLVTGQARQHWISKVAEENPGLIPGILDQLGNRDKVTALQMCLASKKLGEDQKDALIQSLAALPDVPENRALLNAAGDRLAALSENQLRARYEASLDPGIRRIIESAFHVKFVDTEGDREAMKKSLDSMPQEVSEAVLQRTLSDPRQNAPAFTLALDHILDTPEWATREKELCMKLHNMVLVGADEGALAKWADTIPEREDCEDLHRVAMRGLLSGDREKAWKTLDEMPSGWKRDNGYVEYVNRAINVLSDEAEASRGLEAIENEHFKSRANEMIAAWKAKHGK